MSKPINECVDIIKKWRELEKEKCEGFKIANYNNQFFQALGKEEAYDNVLALLEGVH